MTTTNEIESASRIASHVTKNWFPLNRANLEVIRASIKADRYNKESLVQDIKCDASLYLLCVKKLAHMARDGGIKDLTPNELIQNAEVETLSSMINSNLESEAPHQMQSMSDIQAARLKEAMVSASTAEALARSKKCDSDLGFSCALLRQLGLTLIAWNYPHVYRRALETAGLLKTNLESEIQKILGVSPSSLAVIVTKDWNLSSTVNQVMGADTQSGFTRLADNAQNIVDLCRIGEALARANDPENYPSALKDWNNAEDSIERLLGVQGMAIIRDNIAKNLRAYRGISMERFSVATVETMASKICTTEYCKNLLQRNEAINKCSPILKSQLKELYSSFSANEIMRDSVHKLVRQIIPDSGFTKGCIFMYEPSSNSLVPVLKIGTPPEAINRVVSLQGIQTNPQIITESFQRDEIVENIKTSEDGSIETVWLAGTLGKQQKTGVIFLEASKSLMAKGDDAPLSYFTALRQTLSDCLGLK
jgi:hypothetical protein